MDLYKCIAKLESEVANLDQDIKHIKTVNTSSERGDIAIAIKVLKAVDLLGVFDISRERINKAKELIQQANELISQSSLKFVSTKHEFEKKVVLDESMTTDSLGEVKSSKGRKTEKVSTYTFANQDWRDVKIVKRSKGGQRGAWFYSNPQLGSVVVKSQEGTEKQLMGTIFLRGMGINAPDSKRIKRHSVEGEQVSKLGEGVGLNVLNPTHYIIMNRVNGPSFEDLTSSYEDIQLVKDNLERLGELVIYDLVLGNFDRFQMDSMSFNAGNIMFQDGVLHPIDTDCMSVDDDRFNFTKMMLKKIVEERGDYDDKIARKLESNLAGGVENGTFSRSEIKKGMDKAIERLVEFTKAMDTNKKLFIESCQEKGCEEVIFPKHVEELLLHIVKYKSN
jgi:hypothetical protein